jgi:hypothetical protein
VQFAPPCTIRKQSAWYSNSATEIFLPKPATASQSSCITELFSKKSGGSDALNLLISDNEVLSIRTSLCLQTIKFLLICYLLFLFIIICAKHPHKHLRADNHLMKLTSGPRRQK